MPRKKTYCARGPGHPEGQCASADAMQAHRVRRRARVHIDHDHSLGCHPGEKRACDRCRRGLLCLRCNTAVGYIEGYAGLARAYLADPPARSGRL